jgi:hypothetical protein
MRSLAAVILALVVMPMATAVQTSGVADMLDRYLAGDFVGAVRRALEEDRETFVTAYGREVGDWVDGAGDEEATRRRLAAATFALEFAHDERLPNEYNWTPGWWYSRVLVEYACRLLRAAPNVHPAETTWFLASIALVKAAQDQDFLTGRPPRVTGPDRDIGIRDAPPERRPLFPFGGGVVTEPQRLRAFARRSNMAVVDHASDARDRVDDPRILLAVATDTLFPSVLVRGMMQGFAAPKDPRIAPAVKQLTPLRQFPSIRGEVDLYLGLAALLRLQGDDAVALLRGVPQGTDDPSIVYLSSLFLGQIMEMNGRREDAIAAYRQAASWRPYSSVALPLAALLFVTGERDEAVAWTNRSLVIDRPEDDPFVQFGYGDLRRWPMYLAELRASFTERTP